MLHDARAIAFIPAYAWSHGPSVVIQSLLDSKPLKKEINISTGVSNQNMYKMSDHWIQRNSPLQTCDKNVLKVDNSCNLFAKQAMTKTRPIISSSVVITVCRKWRTSLCRWLSLGCTSLSSSTASAVIKPCWNCKSSLCRLLSLWYTSVGHECHACTSEFCFSHEDV